MSDLPPDPLQDEHKMTQLPDSRMEYPTNVMRIEFGQYGRINMEPLFCASCGHGPVAYVPIENMTHAFWLCDNGCSQKWSPLPGTYTTPDTQFWERVKAQSLETTGHFLREEDVLRYESSSCNPLSTLLKESPLKGR